MIGGYQLQTQIAIKLTSNERPNLNYLIRSSHSFRILIRSFPTWQSQIHFPTSHHLNLKIPILNDVSLQIDDVLTCHSSRKTSLNMDCL